MTNTNIEDWMHATDEERADIHNSWNTENLEGKAIAEQIASLLSKECVYNIDKVSVIDKDGKWFIEAFVVVDDYDNLKDRTNIEFLGFKIMFNSMANFSG